MSCTIYYTRLPYISRTFTRKLSISTAQLMFPNYEFVLSSASSILLQVEVLLSQFLPISCLPRIKYQASKVSFSLLAIKQQYQMAKINVLNPSLINFQRFQSHQHTSS